MYVTVEIEELRLDDVSPYLSDPDRVAMWGNGPRHSHLVLKGTKEQRRAFLTALAAVDGLEVCERDPGPSGPVCDWCGKEVRPRVPTGGTEPQWSHKADGDWPALFGCRTNAGHYASVRGSSSAVPSLVML